MTSVATSIARRHDLDALRAIAMLLGIVLHGSLSFIDLPAEAWPVHDVKTHVGFDVFMGMVHGFRMPLFFLISGFFTAMLWRKRGLLALIEHRLKRIALPLVIGMFTIVPLLWFVAITLSMMGATEHAKTNQATAKANPGRTIDADIWVEYSQPPQTVNAIKIADTDHPLTPVSLPSGGPLIDNDGPTRMVRTPDETASTAQQDWSGIVGLIILLGVIPVFHHLWFLWFLCWLVAAFVFYAKLLDVFRWRHLSHRWIVSPKRYVWLLPLTLLPQALMGLLYPVFGPDTSPGILPLPHVLFYYAIFFFFGAMYFDCDDATGRLGCRWRITLPIALLVVFPIGYEAAKGVLVGEWLGDDLERPVSVIMQVLYVWLMTFGLIGLFRERMSGESKVMRYVSDSSYWLYLTHLPLIFIPQFFVRNWDLPAVVKCVLVCVVTSGVLLISYQLFVRYTPIGTLLNGPRKPTTPEPAVTTAQMT
ncbi:MAG: acyltransferase family protein [Pirellulaceae bacterium]|nr:acyltransferase family protein [Pirellulaceae bacterium]